MPPSGDAREPNDSPSSPTSIADGFDDASLTIHTPTDRDVFAIALTGPARIGAALSFMHGRGDIDMRLIASFQTTTVATAQSATDDEAINSSELAAGTYYLEVYGYDGATNDYRLRLTVTSAAPPPPPPPPPPSGDPLEPNDDAASATPAAGGLGRSDLRIDAGDQDVFRIEVSAPADLQIALSFTHADGDIDAELRSGSLTGSLVASGVSGTDDESIAVSAAAGGTYYLRVYGYNGAVNDYGISLAVTPNAPPPPPPPPPPGGGRDQYEPNEDRATAPTVVAPLVFDGRIVGGDEDFFAFESTGQTHSIRIDMTASGADLDLFVTRPDGFFVGDSQTFDPIERVDGAFGTGTFYIRIVGYQGATGDYTLSLQ